jgi:hypothetical protein
MTTLSEHDLNDLRQGWDADPAWSLSLVSHTYTEERWHAIEREAIFAKTWQWVGHTEKLRTPGAYVAVSSLRGCRSASYAAAMVS